MAKKIEDWYWPIIYVRGYAMTAGEVEETVATPYMGFNLGSTKLRQRWTGDLEPYVFESPVVRLMKDHDYVDVYRDGKALYESKFINGDPIKEKCIGRKSIVIYRYYDQVSKDLGTGERPDMEVYAEGLEKLIKNVRDAVCWGDPEMYDAFKVYLVAHSMGGLVCRCFLQNPPTGEKDMRKCVDKVFTYATPHNGIDVRGGFNVPGILSFSNANNFNRKHMADYLGLDGKPKRVDTLDGHFKPSRFFCLVGTDAKDYTAAGGVVRTAVGPLSDGLVRIENATIQKAPRAFVHRSHSGHYGIVNSEEGYQNLTRFLFGDVRVDGILKVHTLRLPRKLEKIKEEDRDKAEEDRRKIRGSYNFEVVVRPRGKAFDLTRRTVAENSSVLRTYDSLMHPDREGRDGPRNPQLFSVFLSTEERVSSQGPLVFSMDLQVGVPEYKVDRFLWDKRVGGFLYRKTIVISAGPNKEAGGEWQVRYGFNTQTPPRKLAEREERKKDSKTQIVFSIPVKFAGRPGIDATLELVTTPWNVPAAAAETP